MQVRLQRCGVGQVRARHLGAGRRPGRIQAPGDHPDWQVPLPELGRNLPADPSRPAYHHDHGDSLRWLAASRGRYCRTVGHELMLKSRARCRLAGTATALQRQMVMDSFDWHEAGLTVGQIAQRSGAAPSALRFYERQGLISADRTASPHRGHAGGGPVASIC